MAGTAGLLPVFALWVPPRSAIGSGDLSARWGWSAGIVLVCLGLATVPAGALRGLERCDVWYLPESWERASFSDLVGAWRLLLAAQHQRKAVSVMKIGLRVGVV